MPISQKVRECLGASDYLIPSLHPDAAILLMCLSAVSTIVVFCEIIRLTCSGGQKKRGTGRATPISLLVRYLVLVQAICDLLFHLVDFIFSRDCDSYPLMYILNGKEDPDYIFHQRTILYKNIKEGLGLLSVWWHATTAYVVYSWIVLKYSALRLRRVRIPYFLLAALVISVIRYVLFMELRMGLLGLYINIFVYDIVLIPFPIAALLVWNYQTAKALRGQYQSSFAMEHQSSPGHSLDSGSGSSFPGGLNHANSRGGDSRSAEGKGGGRGGEEGGGAGEGAGGSERRPEGREEHRSTSGGTTTGGTGVPSGFSVPDDSNSHSTFTRLPSFMRLKTTGGGVHRSGGSNSSKAQVGGGDAGGARTQIIHRLMRISVAVSLLWMTIVIIDLIIWINNRMQGEGAVLGSGILWIRTILLRLVGLIDAVIMGNVFAKCWQRSTKSSVRSRLAKALSSARPIEFSLAPPSFMPGFVHRGEGSTRLVSGALSPAGPTPEEEVEQLIHAVDLMNLPKNATRRLEAVNLFATTWNCGGVEREVLEMGLPRIIGKWIPHGYDLYTLGVQECQCLKELRRIVHDYLGGSEQYVQFGKEIGDAHILHGVIAITVYARTTDVNKGFFQVQEGTITGVASGVSLGPIGRAANKGMVGISCRYYDCSLAIVTAHFASDKKGKNRVANRNKDACKTLTDLSLLWDSDEFDIHTQHSHTILLGDLNYRNSGTTAKVLSLIAESAQQVQAMFEKEKAASMSSAAAAPSSHSSHRQPCNNWRTKNYSRLAEIPDDSSTVPLFPSLQQSMISGISFAYSQAGGPISPTFHLRATLASRLGSQISSLKGTYIAEEDEDISSTKDLSSLEAGRGGGGGRGTAVEGKEVTGMELPSLTSPILFPTLGFSNRSVNSRSSRGCKSRTSSTHTPCPSRPWTMSEVSPWEWVNHYDELGRFMRERVVFWGFKEPPITFPPSYRWNRGALLLPPAKTAVVDDEEAGGREGKDDDLLTSGTGLAGDYTQYKTLLTSYTIAVHDRPSSFVPRFSYARPHSETKSGSSGGGAGVGTASTPSPTTIISRQTPSSSGGGGGKGKTAVAPSPSAIAIAPPALASTFISKSISRADSDPPNPTFSARVPSYTDRILTYSLPSKASGLKWRCYDMADEIMLSDHRPVAAALSMLIDRDVCGFKQLPSLLTSASASSAAAAASPGSATPISTTTTTNLDRNDSGPSLEGGGGGGGGGGEGVKGGAVTPVALPPSPGTSPSSPIKGLLDSTNNSDLAVFTITLANPTVRLKTAAAGGVAGRLMRAFSSAGSVEPQEMTILMPLISEDPMALERKASLLKEAMPGVDISGSGSPSSSSLRQVLWSQFPIRLRIVASRRFSEHMLIKVTGFQGTALGQAIIPICLASREGPSITLEKERINSGVISQQSAETDPPPTGLAMELQEGVRLPPAPPPATRSGPTSGDKRSRRMQVLLSSGGVFKGWLTLDLKVKIRNVSGGEERQAPTHKS